MPNNAPFTNINQHWHHFLERDIPRDAPLVQVDAMRKAFAAGAISGLHLSITASSPAAINRHAEEIEKLGRA